MSQTRLHFPGGQPDFYTQLSALAFVGGDMWVGADEGQGIVRLRTGDEGKTWEAAAPSSLAAVLDLPGKKTEIDLEGMDWDPASGHLWLIGSHSLKRKNAIKDPGDLPNLDRLATVEPDKNRYVLARVPLHLEDAGSRLLTTGEFTDAKFAAQLECAESGLFRNALYHALQDDPHFGRFVQRQLGKNDKGDDLDLRGIPSKDNGLDIEGLAFAGTTDKGVARLFIGLRGPVLRGWAAVLEVQVTAERAGGNHAGRLKLETIGDDGRPHRRIFLQLDGLGVRDLCFRGDDLLILAGPTMALDWPVAVYRWIGAKTAAGVDLILDQAPGVLESVPLAVDPNPPGEKGNRAEGLALLPPGAKDDVLILYDAPGPSHLPVGEETVIGDIFPLNLPPT